ncbi:hypothetical protein G4B88_000951 [Cannabis sativa]|uniref:Polygalacturonase n=1 Tax=Cannabis sativa TaxID=3483 RepID=A0A7J6EZ67_CANSA|nr:hypothetical protein G4B88_000951 [Cannabis sativa]
MCHPHTFNLLFVLSWSYSPSDPSIVVKKYPILIVASMSSHISIINLFCGPGHGVSIGSLGKDGSVANVSNIKVHRVKFFGTSNGVHIKTYKGLLNTSSFAI